NGGTGGTSVFFGGISNTAVGNTSTGGNGGNGLNAGAGGVGGTITLTATSTIGLGANVTEDGGTGGALSQNGGQLSGGGNGATAKLIAGNGGSSGTSGAGGIGGTLKITATGNISSPNTGTLIETEGGSGGQADAVGGNGGSSTFGAGA